MGTVTFYVVHEWLRKYAYYKTNQIPDEQVKSFLRINFKPIELNNFQLKQIFNHALVTAYPVAHIPSIIVSQSRHLLIRVGG